MVEKDASISQSSRSDLRQTGTEKARHALVIVAGRRKARCGHEASPRGGKSQQDKQQSLGANYNLKIQQRAVLGLSSDQLKTQFKKIELTSLRLFR